MNRVHENGRACNACEHVLAREGDGFCSHCGAPISAEAREAVTERAREIDQEVRALKPEGSARDRRAYRAGARSEGRRAGSDRSGRRGSRC